MQGNDFVQSLMYAARRDVRELPRSHGREQRD